MACLDNEQQGVRLALDATDLTKASMEDVEGPANAIVRAPQTIRGSDHRQRQGSTFGDCEHSIVLMGS